MEKLGTPAYNDFWWDTAPPSERSEIILKKQIIPTILFAKNYVPFYMQHYKHLSESTILNVSSLDEFVDLIPFISKSHLAYNHPLAFLPVTGVKEIDPLKGKYLRFGTGGTTGKPILVMHSIQDWRGIELTLGRPIEFDFYMDPHVIKDFNFEKGFFDYQGKKSRLTPFYGKGIIGAYNGDHITNGVFATMLHRLGCDFYWRPSAAPSNEDIYETAQQFKVNGILAPPEGDNIKKGTFLRNILEAEINLGASCSWRLSHRFNKDFQFVLWSSMPISQGLLDHLQNDRQIPYIRGQFGSTEVCPTGASCSQHPRAFHMSFGHSLVLTKKIGAKGLAAPDELGYTLVSKIGATSADGDNVLPSGMIFLNYMTGDAAKLSKDGTVCGCGRNTPVLYDFQRVEFHEGQAKHGCQVA